MAKDTEIDEGVKDAEIPGEVVKEQPQEREPPKDLRGAIRAAMDEVNEKDEDRRDTKEAKGDIEEVREDKEDKRPAKRVDREPREERVAEEVKEEPKIDPPPYYKNKGKAAWDKLGAEEKNLLIAREKEVSDGFQQISQRIRSVEDVERAIAPRLQAIQQFGVSPGVVVDRLFLWMEGLENPKTKLNTFKQLAQAFGVNINQLTPQENADPNAPPEWFNDFANGVSQEIGTVKQQVNNQSQAAAQSYILNWAKDKPHYNQVAPLMGQLMDSGVVPPLVNGVINLDGAYEAAIKLNPDVSALIQQEQAAKTKAEADAKIAKDAKERADKLAKARRASVGLKPGAPSPAANLNGKAPDKPSSIRDSIRAAIDELRS